VSAFEVIGHRTSETCPYCKRPTFCDDCGICADCGFSAPFVLPQPDPPAPRNACPECEGTMLHSRTCSVTARSLAN